MMKSRSQSQRPYEVLNFGRKRVQPLVLSQEERIDTNPKRGKSQRGRSIKHLKDDASLDNLRHFSDRSKSPFEEDETLFIPRHRLYDIDSQAERHTRLQSRQRHHPHHHQKKPGNLGKQKLEKVSKDKSVVGKRKQLPSRQNKKRKRVEFEFGSSDYEVDEESYISAMTTKATKQRKLNIKCKVLWLRMQKNTKMKRPFPLYADKDIFRCRSKECYEIFETHLIDHVHDDDYNTEEELVDDHVDMCLDELRTRINEFLQGDPLELCRNARDEFSGIEKIECREDEDANSSPDSSWYEILSVPTDR